MNPLKEHIHIYTTPKQKATRYRDAGGFGIINNKPQSLIRAWCCNKGRWAKNLTVQSYYDGDRYWCVEGKGCKKK